MSSKNKTTTNKSNASTVKTRVRKSRAKQVETRVETTKVVSSFDATRHANGMILTLARPGVLSTMKECLYAASAESPVTKSDILRVLVAKFAQRDAVKMKSTLMMQLPSGLRIEARIVLVSVKLATSSERAYYVDIDATNALQAAHAASKLKS